MVKIHTEALEQLYKAIVSIENEEECAAFLEDICTIKELQDMAQRLEVAKQLTDKKVFREIAESTGASSATISRVNRCIMYGAGGYEKALSRMKKDSPQK